jgi:hypothetical protein
MLEGIRGSSCLAFSSMDEVAKVVVVLEFRNLMVWMMEHYIQQSQHRVQLSRFIEFPRRIRGTEQEVRVKLAFDFRELVGELNETTIAFTLELWKG